ncbi:hypothetical protein [Ideonella sp. BN130291]|uniref:hypothetical protein n=1 Tax=Ideonella sp. BN130291 TaxID=3112940 RepID=UPI002E25A0C9|nr:hypothetical protein [Ideonella sp. BN130291]
MTSNKSQGTGAGVWGSASVAEDQRALADQLVRCSRRRRTMAAWQVRAQQLRSFTASHVISMTALGVLALSGLSLLA